MSVAPTNSTGRAPGSAALAAYDTQFQVAPIGLCGGIVTAAAGGGSGFVPITTYMSGLSAQTRFVPVEGATTVDQSVGMYPFANQSVAANATIQNPLTFSLRMISPVTDSGGYTSKAQVYFAFFGKLQEHNAAGGWYIVYTPSYTYLTALLLKVSDVTPNADNSQRQIEWQFDFIQPLLTTDQAQTVENRLISMLSGGQQLSADETGSIYWSGQPGSSPGIPGNAASLVGQQNIVVNMSVVQ